MRLDQTASQVRVRVVRPGQVAHQARSHAWPALAGLALGVLALGPALGRGFVLSYDMVFVPHPPLGAAVFGLTQGPPRAVPSDLVIGLAARVLPSDIVQKALLLLIFVLACCGAAALARCRPGASRDDGPLLPGMAAGVMYAWNPFVAERLIMGQWALLLGYAGLPWVVCAACHRDDRIRFGRLCGALVPAAVGGFSAMAISALVLIPAAWAGGPPGRKARSLATAVAALAILSLPWLIPALAIGVHTDPGAVRAFAARADTPFGRLGSLLMLGGIWNAQAVPAGYGGAVSAGWLAVAVAGGAGYLIVAWRQRRQPGLGIAAVAGLAICAAETTAPGKAALQSMIAFWPGFAVLRDGQQFLAPLALAEAVGLGAAAAWLLAGTRQGHSGRQSGGRTGGQPKDQAPRSPKALPSPERAASAAGPATSICVLAMLAPVVLLPGLAWGAAGRLRAVQYPADWLQSRQIMSRDPHPGAVLVLPWASYRRYPWNHGAAVFDPWPKLPSRTVIWNDALRVGTLTVTAESAAARRLGQVLASPGPLTGALRSAGIRYVVIDAGPLLSRTGSGLAGPGLAVQAGLPGASVLLASHDLILIRLPAAQPARRGKVLRR